MASEAQRLIGISLTKIAQSRANRGGVSLHKNLLVATVLQKARYIFMEEAYNMVHYQQQQQQQQQQAPAPVVCKAPTIVSSSEENLVGLTAEEAGIDAAVTLAEDVGEASNLEFLPVAATPTCVKCVEKESNNNNNNNQSVVQNSEVTYLDLDNKTSTSSLPSRSSSSSTPCLKRRRAVTDWETEEAVQSILPKRVRCSSSASSSSSSSEDGDDCVFLDDASAILSDVVAKELEETESSRSSVAAPPSQQQQNGSSAMEIDRITSLVSIFSFGMGEGGSSKINRSVSTPDLCSAQAKDQGDALQQRPFIAMTV